MTWKDIFSLTKTFGRAEEVYVGKDTAEHV
jgi:hypothetical protein